MPSSEFYWRLGAALLISGCLYSLGAEKANLTTAKLTYASLGAPAMGPQ